MQLSAWQNRNLAFKLECFQKNTSLPMKIVLYILMSRHDATPENAIKYIFVCYKYIYIFFDMSTQRGRKIRTNDLHFIKCDLSQLSYLLKTIYIYIYI
jgi:hypothetical protein